MTDILRTSAPSAGPESYGAFARALHWGMAGGILFTFLLGLSVDAFPRAFENTVVQIHMVIGVSLVVLLVLRVAARLISGAPAPEPGGGALLNRLAGLGHLGLYALMLVVPLTGLAVTFLRGRGIDFGLFSIASPLAADRALARPAKEIHELLSWALVLLAGVHVVAAFWHHLVLRDGTLRRMMPAR